MAKRSKPEFVEAEGNVHLVGPGTGGEFTLCGDAFDLGSDIDGYVWSPTRRRAVTCPRCAAIVLGCRGVKIDVDPC